MFIFFLILQLILLALIFRLLELLERGSQMNYNRILHKQ